MKLSRQVSDEDVLSVDGKLLEGHRKGRDMRLGTLIDQRIYTGVYPLHDADIYVRQP